MCITYQLTSAQEMNSDLLDAIKATFKSKPITIIVQENEKDPMDIGFELSNEMKAVLDERLKEDEQTYFSSETSVNQLREKYGL